MLELHLQKLPIQEVRTLMLSHAREVARQLDCTVEPQLGLDETQSFLPPLKLREGNLENAFATAAHFRQKYLRGEVVDFRFGKVNENPYQLGLTAANEPRILVLNSAFNGCLVEDAGHPGDFVLVAAYVLRPNSP